MFILDIETLGVESTSAILSIAVLHLDESTTDFQSMLDNSIFVKFDLKEQFKNNRTEDRTTCEWWDKQTEQVKIASLYPSEGDFSFCEGIDIVETWMKNKGFTKNSSVFARGSLDSLCLESCYRTFDKTPLIKYYQWLDVRTAIDMMYDNSRYGYVDVEYEGFETYMVVKHNPVYDCAYDGMMLKYGKN